MTAPSRLRAVTVLTSALTIAVFTASTARADDPSKRECIDANAQAQVQQKEGKLRAAQTSLRLCTSSSCPAIVRDDCAQRLDALERVLPSLVFEVKDGSGADLTAVRVLLDGQVLAEKLDGTALDVDPGEHSFTFQAAARAPVTMKLVIREGDRGRRQAVRMGAAAVTPPTPVVVLSPSPSPSPPPTPSAKEPSGRVEPPPQPPPDTGNAGDGQRTAGLVLGIGGAVGLGVAGLLAASASSSWSSSQTNCASSAECTNRPDAVADRDSAVTLATGATIAFIAGGALLTTGLILYFTAPTTAAPATGMRVLPTLGGALLVGSF